MIRVVNVTGLKGAARAGIVYVGRRFAGWEGSRFGNPYRPVANDPAGHCLALYKAHVERMPDLEKHLAQLWKQTMEGHLPLGCWCVKATAGDGSPVVCHAQILAEMLRERFVPGEPQDWWFDDKPLSQ